MLDKGRKTDYNANDVFIWRESMQIQLSDHFSYKKLNEAIRKRDEASNTKQVLQGQRAELQAKKDVVENVIKKWTFLKEPKEEGMMLAAGYYLAVKQLIDEKNESDSDILPRSDRTLFSV